MSRHTCVAAARADLSSLTLTPEKCWLGHGALRRHYVPCLAHYIAFLDCLAAQVGLSLPQMHCFLCCGAAEPA